MRLRVTPVAGAGFENPLFSEFNLGSAIERGDAIVAFAGGASSIGPLRAVMEWPNVASHADKHPVTLFYLNCGDKPAPADPDDLDAVEQANGRGAAFVEQWDEWREGGAAVVPCFGPFFDDGVFAVQSAMVGGVAEWGGKHGTVMGKDAFASPSCWRDWRRRRCPPSFASPRCRLCRRNRYSRCRDSCPGKAKREERTARAIVSCA